MSKYIEQPKKSSWEVYAWVHRSSKQPYQRFQQPITPFGSFSSILSEENRVDIVDNWLDVQGVIQTDIYSRKQEDVVGENSKWSRVARLRKCDL